jgi:Glycosyltransferase family 28 C-terminal domain
MIGYYVHHHGFGHLARAMSICAQMRRPVTVMTSMNVPEPHPFSRVLQLPRDDEDPRPREVTAHGALHWAPHHDAGFSSRMTEIAGWVSETQPEAVVVDVSVEVAVFVRLLGVPVIVMALPGNRMDAPHLLVHRIADHIVAGWPRALCVPTWLRQWERKTSYVGGISRFEGRDRPLYESESSARATPLDRTHVVVLSGADDTFDASLQDCAAAHSAFSWTALGGKDAAWEHDPWPEIRAADVVVTHAGQGCIADVAAARRPAVVIPRARPFDEQHATARALQRHRLAVVAQRWPDPRAWPALLAKATATDPDRWRQWEVDGAARRAAEAIEATARGCRQGT